MVKNFGIPHMLVCRPRVHSKRNSTVTYLKKVEPPYFGFGHSTCCSSMKPSSYRTNLYTCILQHESWKMIARDSVNHAWFITEPRIEEGWKNSLDHDSHVFIHTYTAACCKANTSSHEAPCVQCEAKTVARIYKQLLR